MDAAFGSIRLFSLRRGQDKQPLPGEEARACSPNTARVLGRELLDAVRCGDVESTTNLLQAGADPNATSEDLLASPLHTAAMLGRTIWSDAPVYGVDMGLRLMRELLAAGAHVDAVDKYGFSALHLATATGDADMVSLLLRSGANPSVQDYELLFTPLHVAISNGKMNVAFQLIEAGIDTARTDYTGRSAWQVFAAVPSQSPAPGAGAGAAGPAAATGGSVRNGGNSSGGGGAVKPAPDGPTWMLQLLLAGLQEGRAIPVSTVFNLMLEITGSTGAEKAGGPASAIGKATTDATDTANAGGGPAGAMVRQLVAVICDLGDPRGCWQLLAEAVRCGAGAVAALVVRAVMLLHPGSLEEIPWGGVLVDLLACLPDVFDQLVAELKLAPAEHLAAAVRQLHPSRLDPSTRLLLYRRLVAALRQQQQERDCEERKREEGKERQQHKQQPRCGSSGGGDGGGRDGAVVRAFLQELPPDTVADLAVTPFFQDFTRLLPGSLAGLATEGRRERAAAQRGPQDADAEDDSGAAAVAGDKEPADVAAAASSSAEGMRVLMLQSNAGGPLEAFTVTNLLKGAMQSGSLLAVDYVVQSVLAWQHAASAAGHRALLLGLNSHLLDGLAMFFPTSCRALMQMPRQRGPLMHVRLPRGSAHRAGQQLLRCSSSTVHHLVWWPRLARALTTGPRAAGDLAAVEVLLADGLPLESLYVLASGRDDRQRGGEDGGGGGGRDGGGGGGEGRRRSDGGRGGGPGSCDGGGGRSKKWGAGGGAVGGNKRSEMQVVAAETAAAGCKARKSGSLCSGGSAVVPLRGDGGGEEHRGLELTAKAGIPAGYGPWTAGAATEADTAAAPCGVVPTAMTAITIFEGGRATAERPDGWADGGEVGRSDGRGGLEGHALGPGPPLGCGVALMRQLMERGLTPGQINSLVCSGTALSGVVAALDHGVPLHLIAGLLDAGLCFQIVEALLHRSVHQSTRYWKLRPHNELFFKLPFATWHNGIGYAFFGPLLAEWAAAGWDRGFIDRIFHANDPLAARLKAAYDHRGVPQRLPSPMMAAHDPLLAATVQRRLLLMRVFLAGWWLPQRWATAALLAAGWAAEVGARWWLARGRAAGMRSRLRQQQAEHQELVPHDAVSEMLPVHGIARVGRAGLLQGLTKAEVPSDWYGLELPRAVVVVHWEGYARALFAMLGLEHMLLMGLYGVFLWALRSALIDAEQAQLLLKSQPQQPQPQLQPPQPSGSASTTQQGPNSSLADGGGELSGGSWLFGDLRLSLLLLLVAWTAAAGLVLEGLRARANGLAAYRSHQANWLRVASGCMTLAMLVVLLVGGSGGGGGRGAPDDEAAERLEKWWSSLQVALALGSVQVLLLCYQLLLFSSLSDGMGGLVRMVVEVVKSMGYFFLMLAVVFGGFAAAFVVLMTISLDLTAFALRLFTVMLGDFANEELHTMLMGGTFLVPELGVVLMAAYGVVLIIVLVNLLIAIMTDAYAKVRSSEGAEVARNQAYIINDLQLGLPAGLAKRIETKLLGPYLHLLTVTAADGQRRDGGGWELGRERQGWGRHATEGK